MAKKVFISVGHGGSDPGAVGNGLKEKSLNLVIAQECNKVLVEHGVITLMSRSKDENDTVNDEIKECNAFNPDYGISIHNNAGGGDGVEAWYHHGGGKGKILAENVLAEVVKLGQNSRGAKTWKNSEGNDYHGIIRLTTCPMVIVECAFIDNATDIEIVDTVAEQKAMGVAIAKGILKTLGIAYKEPVVEKPSVAKPSAEKWFKVQVGAFRKRSGAEALKKELETKGYRPFIVEI